MFVIVAVLLLIAGICAGEQARLTPHPDVSETCCGFVQCSMLPSVLLGFTPWLIARNLRPEAVPSVRFSAQDPLSPPPELIALRSA